MISKKYPDAYDIGELVNLRTTSPAAIRSFAASRGILVAGRGKEVMAGSLSRLLLDHYSYLDLRYYAQGGVGKTSVSGFNIRDWSNPSKTTGDIYKDIMKFREELASQKRKATHKNSAITINPLQIVDDSIETSYTYYRVVPGKIELLSYYKETVEFIIAPIADRRWRVLCLPKYNQDVETLQKLFGKIDKEAYEVYTISLDKFPIPQRIAFFDSLLEYYSHPRPEVEWRLRQVRGIVVKQADKKKPAAAPEEDIFDIDSDTSLSELIESEDTSDKKVKVSDLKSITRAALEGENLRHNSFVQECEKAGFFFSSMTLELENKNTPEVIQVQVRFKEIPKMFEVILIKTVFSSEIGEVEGQLEPEREQEVLEEFWKVSHDIWHNIDEGLPASAEVQTVINFTGA